MIGLLGLLASAQAAALPAERSAIHSTSYQLPLTFEVNQGQTDGQVKFLARGQGYTIFLTPTEAVFALPRPDARDKSVSDAAKGRTVMRMQLIDSAPAPRMQGVDELPGKVNYFRGSNSTKWRTSVRTYRRVKCTAVYPGVDLVYYGNSRQLEYDFIVAPGSDPSTIKLAFAGTDDTTVDARGDLVLNTASGPLRFQKPIIYQIEDGRRHIVEGGYVQQSPREIGFRVGDYDRTRPLIIDPVLSYATYLGGSEQDFGAGIALDATGATYVTGFTASSNFPTVNALQPTSTDYDAFVAKFTPDGTALVYATYLGGSGAERGFSIAVDSAGAVYVTGDTQSADFPTERAWQGTFKGIGDAFVAKLSADGSQLVYSTYLGGRKYDSSGDIAVDPVGAAYITGPTFSPDFPTVNGFQPVCTEPPTPEPVNAFVAKFAPDGTAAYISYLGGDSQDNGTGIAVDSAGAAYVTGATSSTGFPSVNPVQPTCGSGVGDAFVTKVAPNGESLIYSTCLGGGGPDVGLGIALDLSGAAYVTGITESSDFPTVNALQPVSGERSIYNRLLDGGDAFVAKLPPEGGALMYATYLGGRREDRGDSITVDTAGAAYVTGSTLSFDFPTNNPLQPALRGARDAFVAKLASDGASLAYSTYLGGSELENGSAIALDLAGAAYITGYTSSTDFPTVQPLQASNNSASYLGSDAYIAKFTDSLASAPASNVSGDSNRRDKGGGSIDALLALLLAHLTFTRALRRRI